MASKKISQLPPASIIDGTSLLALVNTTSGITERATVSQLPSGIISVNNLGGGATLGTITGSQLALKTLIPGTALTFTVTANTITINNNLSMTSLGTGVPILNSFTNPNAAFKSIIAGNGIRVTDNTTSITISSSINSALDSIIGAIEIPTVKVYTLENYINKPYTVSNIYLTNSEGTATVRLKKQDATGSDIGSTSTFNVSNVRSNNIVTSFTTAVGNQLVLEVLTTNSSANLSFTIEITYI